MTIYPDVPPLPGVPPLSRLPGTSYPSQPMATSDSPGVLASAQGPQWGIFDQGGNPVIVGDNVKSVEFTGDSRISNYPIEAGGFQSYNKVQLPNIIKVTFTKGVSVAERSAFLAACESAKQSLYLFAVVTPEDTYTSVNVTHYDYRRTARQGATLLTVDVWGEEVRPAAPLGFTTAQQTQQGTVTLGTPQVVSPGPTPVTSSNSPSGASPVSGGTVQPYTPSGASGHGSVTIPFPRNPTSSDLPSGP